jgi:hypothetical protein
MALRSDGNTNSKAHTNNLSKNPTEMSQTTDHISNGRVESEANIAEFNLFKPSQAFDNTPPLDTMEPEGAVKISLKRRLISPMELEIVGRNKKQKRVADAETLGQDKDKVMVPFCEDVELIVSDLPSKATKSTKATTDPHHFILLPLPDAPESSSEALAKVA